MERNILFEGLKKYTVEHSLRTHDLSIFLARALKLDKKMVQKIGIAAMYHDIGKANVPKSIREKQGALTDEEYDLMKQHVAYGHYMSAEIFNDELKDIIKYHHENEDGSGYYGLKGDEIPLGAKIIHICDVYDALTSSRPYHKKIPKKEALTFIVNNMDIMFDKEIATVFVEKLKKNKASRDAIKNGGRGS